MQTSSSGFGSSLLPAVGIVRRVDVENLRNIGLDPFGVAEMICSRPETDALRWAPTTTRAGHFVSIWTLKAAVAKAMGLGFHFPLGRITIHWDGGGPRAVVDGIARLWSLALSGQTPEQSGGSRGARRKRGRNCDPLRGQWRLRTLGEKAVGNALRFSRATIVEGCDGWWHSR